MSPYRAPLVVLVLVPGFWGLAFGLWYWSGGPFVLALALAILVPAAALVTVLDVADALGGSRRPPPDPDALSRSLAGRPGLAPRSRGRPGPRRGGRRR